MRSHADKVQGEKQTNEQDQDLTSMKKKYQFLIITNRHWLSEQKKNNNNNGDDDDETKAPTTLGTDILLRRKKPITHIRRRRRIKKNRVVTNSSCCRKLWLQITHKRVCVDGRRRASTFIYCCNIEQNRFAGQKKKINRIKVNVYMSTRAHAIFIHGLLSCVRRSVCIIFFFSSHPLKQKIKSALFCNNNNKKPKWDEKNGRERTRAHITRALTVCI